MNKYYDFCFVYSVSPGKDNLFSVCCSDKKGRKMKSIENVGERAAAEIFCSFLNEGRIHPCHFEDIYEDYFG